MAVRGHACNVVECDVKYRQALRQRSGERPCRSGHEAFLWDGMLVSLKVSSGQHAYGL